MTALTEAPTSSDTADRRLGVLIFAMGFVCVATLAASDGMGPRSLPPDASLYTLQNWLQAIAISTSGLLLAGANTRVSFRWVAAGVTLASAGLLAGSAIVAVKHWRPYGGMAIGYERIGEMEMLSIVNATAALIAAAGVSVWLYRSGAFPSPVSRSLRVLAIVAGIAIALAVPPLVGLGSSETMDAKSLGAFALIYALPWGVTIALTAALNRQAAIGSLSVVVISSACTVLLPPMPDLVFGTAVPAGVLGLAAASAALMSRILGNHAAPG